MSYAEYNSNSSTKGLWHLNGNSTDSSSNANNGTDTAITYGLGYGKFGQGANFNGTSSDINIASNLGIDGGNITISAWTNFSDLTVLRELFSTLSATSKVGYYIETNSTLIRFYRVKKGVVADAVTYTVSLSTGVWYHYVLTYDGTNIKGYFNGNLVGTTATSGNGATVVTSQSHIGTEDGTGNFMNGSIDEVIVENRAWSTSEIRRYYAQAKGRLASNIL